jgi:hypothetical protein
MTRLRARLSLIVSVLVALSVSTATAQVTPSPDRIPPDDTPSVRIGGVLFGDYTYTLAPDAVDADGHRFNVNGFNIARAYINVAGQLNHVFAFRITPDIVRETGTGSSLNGRLTLDLKYGFMQVNLDDWLWRGSYVRAGMIQTPYVDFEEGIYRYRFQGTVFSEREGFLPSSDYGVAFRTQFPRGYGEAVAGVYNGEGFARAEANDQKALQLRGTLRPFPNANAARGIRLTMFYDGDRYSSDAERRRVIALASFEHRLVNAAVEYLSAADRATRATTTIKSSGFSAWATPRMQLGPVPVAPPAGIVRATLEGLFRYDRLEPDHANRGAKDRWIAGVAYWPSMQAASVTASFLLDYEQVRYRRFATARPTEKRVAVHMLVTF